MNEGSGSDLDIFRWAQQTDTPSAIIPAFVEWLLASPTPERVEQIRDRLGAEGVGIVARGVLEKLLDTVNEEHDMRHFPERFEALPESFSKALFGEGYQRVRDIAITSQALFH